MKINVEVSGEHIHLSEEDKNTLFGVNYELKPLRELSQPGNFAVEEKVEFTSFAGNSRNLRVVAPERKNTQIELSMTDADELEVDAPLRESGDIKDSAGGVLRGPNGKVELNEGVIVIKRHIHLSPSEAEELKLSEAQYVSVKTEGERSVIFNNVFIRISENFKLSMHIDTDEGNAAGMPKGGQGEIV